MGEKAKNLSAEEILHIEGANSVQEQRIKALQKADGEIAHLIQQAQSKELSAEQTLNILLKTAKRLAEFQENLDTTLSTQEDVNQLLSE